MPKPLRRRNTAQRTVRVVAYLTFNDGAYWFSANEAQWADIVAAAQSGSRSRIGSIATPLQRAPSDKATEGVPVIDPDNYVRRADWQQLDELVRQALEMRRAQPPAPKTAPRSVKTVAYIKFGGQHWSATESQWGALVEKGTTLPPVVWRSLVSRLVTLLEHRPARDSVVPILRVDDFEYAEDWEQADEEVKRTAAMVRRVRGAR